MPEPMSDAAYSEYLKREFKRPFNSEELRILWVRALEQAEQAGNEGAQAVMRQMWLNLTVALDHVRVRVLRDEEAMEQLREMEAQQGKE